MGDRFENVELPSSPEDLANRPEFVKALKDEHFWNRIPLMNAMAVAELGNMQIVRFRGMLQDMAEPELYATRYEVRNKKTGTTRHENGKYREHHGMQRDEFVVATDKPVLDMRRRFYVVTVPGLNTWAVQHESENNRNNNNNFVKAPSADGAAMDTGETPGATEPKRARLCDTAHQPDDAMDEENAAAVVCFDAEAVEPERTGPKYPGRDAFNSPIRSRPSRGCTVVVYDDYDSFPLNSLVDVVGFVWLDDPAGDQQQQQQQIPRLHAIRMRTLDCYNPLLDGGAKATPNMAATQRDLMTLLRLCVFDDELAAQYLLMHLVSRVYVRTEVAAIGKFSVNLWRIPSALDYFPRELYQVLELLIPASHYLPLTLDNLRSIPFRASKDYDANCLLSGLLQLAPHTHLVLDETLLTEGTMEATELHNMSDLELLVDCQQSRVQFGPFTKDFAADVPVLILSQGRSILQSPVDIDLPLQPDPQRVTIGLESFKAARHFLTAERLDAMRRYLTVAKMAAVDVSESMCDHMTEDYVKMRAAGGAAAAGPCDSQDLHRLMMMSRMLAISEGKSHVDHDAWNTAKSLLEEMKKRQSSYPHRTSTKFQFQWERP